MRCGEPGTSALVSVNVSNWKAGAAELDDDDGGGDALSFEHAPSTTALAPATRNDRRLNKGRAKGESLQWAQRQTPTRSGGVTRKERWPTNVARDDLRD